jgi:hypothetical protein
MTPNFPKDDDYINMPLQNFNEPDFAGYIPTEVYHYTKLQIALERILLDKTILLREITHTNDPRESKKRFYSDLSWGNLNNSHGSLEIEDQKITGEWRVFCTCCSYHPPSNFIKEYFVAQRENRLGDHHKYGMSYSRMWAQYAENHSGICLIFDGQQLHNNIETMFKNNDYKIRHGFVRYDYDLSVRNLPPAPDLAINDSDHDDRLRHYQDKYHVDYFLYKSKEWQAEHEFRWLVHSKDQTEEMKVPIEKAIKAVVLGVDCSSVYEPSIQALCDKLGIQMYKMRWLGGRPRSDRVHD